MKYSFTIGSLCGGYIAIYRANLSGGGYRLHFDAELTRWK